MSWDWFVAACAWSLIVGLFSRLDLSAPGWWFARRGLARLDERCAQQRLSRHRLPVDDCLLRYWVDAGYTRMTYHRSYPPK